MDKENTVEKVLCVNCEKKVPYEVRSFTGKCDIKGEPVEYDCLVAFCTYCHEEVHVAEVDEFNVHSARNAYCKKKNLITSDQIIELENKYGIGSKPLSQLLCWGEITIVRFVNGCIPSKVYSDVLMTLLNDENAFYRLVEENKSRIKPSAYDRLMAKKNLTESEAKELLPETSLGEDFKKIISELKYSVYPAVFHGDEKGFTVRFPDLPGCIACGDSVSYAFDMAGDILYKRLTGPDAGDAPAPSDILSIKKDDGDLVMLVKAMPYLERPVKKNIISDSVSKGLTDRNLSIDNVADIMNVERAEIAKVASGETASTKDVARRLGLLLNIDWKILLGEADNDAVESAA